MGNIEQTPQVKAPLFLLDKKDSKKYKKIEYSSLE